MMKQLAALRKAMKAALESGDDEALRNAVKQYLMIWRNAYPS